MAMTDSPRVVPVTALGRRFRSTTEARWATFLTSLGVAYEYEPETFDLPTSGWYLPDLWLPGLDLFLEVKPALVEEDAEAKARELATMTGKTVLVAHGFGHPDEWDHPAIRDGQPGFIECWYPEGWDAPYAFTACVCSAIGCTFEARTDYLRNHRCRVEVQDHRDCPRCPGKYARDVARLRNAYETGTRFRPDKR
jgi:hypothetical protein